MSAKKKQYETRVPLEATMAMTIANNVIGCLRASLVPGVSSPYDNLEPVFPRSIKVFSIDSQSSGDTPPDDVTDRYDMRVVLWGHGVRTTLDLHYDDDKGPVPEVIMGDLTIRWGKQYEKRGFTVPAAAFNVFANETHTLPRVRWPGFDDALPVPKPMD